MPVHEPDSGRPGDRRAIRARWPSRRQAVFPGMRAQRDTRAAFAAYARCDLEESAARFGRALQRYRAKDPSSVEVAECLNALARIHHDRGDFARAAQAAQEAWDIARRTRTARGREETASALNNLARVDLACGRHDDALAKFGQAHDLLTDHGRPTLASAVVQQNIGSVHDAMNDLAAALTHYQQALDTFTALGGSSERRVGCLNNIAVVHQERSEFDSALSLLGEALGLCEEGRLVAEGAAVLLNMGTILADRGDYPEGISRMEGALRIRQAIAAGSPGVASAHGRLAWAYLASGRIDDAAIHARDAASLQSGLSPGSAAHAQSLATAGSVQHAKGDFDEALRLQRQALTIHQAIQADSLGVGTDLNNIGLIYHDLGDLRRAARYYTRALACFEASAPQSPAAATVHNNLGVVLRSLGDLDGASRHLEVALVLDRQASARSPAVAADLMNIAPVLLAKGDQRQALAYLAEAVDLDSAAAPGSPATAASLDALATAHAQTGNLDAAIPLVRKAIEIDRASAPRSSRMVSDLTLLGDLLIQRGELTEAIEILTEAADLVDSIRLRAGSDGRRREFALADRHATYRYLIAALLRQDHHGDEQAAFLYSERARARSLNDRLEQEERAGQLSGEVRDLLAEEDRLRRRLSVLRRSLTTQSSPSAPAGADRITGEHARLEERLDDVIELRLARSTPGESRGSGQSVRSLADMQRKLAASEMVMCYHIGAEAVIAWALTAGQLRTYILPITAQKLAEVVDQVTLPYRQGRLGDGSQEDALNELAFALLAPWHVESRSPGVSHLVVVPDGRLAYLPFEILPLPDGRLLADHLTVSYAPSVTTLLGLRARPASSAPGTFVAFADPVISQTRLPVPGHVDAERAMPGEVLPWADDPATLLLPPGHQLSPLPGTRAEARDIASLFGAEGVWFTGQDNTAQQVREAASRYRIQHWATHCLLDEMDPDFSGLVVSPPVSQAPGSEVIDDLVTVHDLARLSLQADLVVCSACQTGLGAVRAGEGTIGISQALLAAGARCVVLSLWPVPDRPTRRLMLAFYKALRRGQPPADALRAAKAEVRRHYPSIYQSPFTWAAFVVIGDGGARDKPPQSGQLHVR
jgi:CHAT domain-containing protein/Tfp pilus assembly protein PilF